MQRIKQWWQASDRLAIVISLVMGILVTGLAARSGLISRVLMVGGLLLIINSGLSGMLLWFPGAYLLGAYQFAPRYMWPFALVYLGISYLAWSMSKPD